MVAAWHRNRAIAKKPFITVRRLLLQYWVEP
jgi:hypothetical protein